MEDLNSIIIRDNHGKQTFIKIVRSRLIITALVVLLQIVFLVLFILRLQQYIEYYFLVSIIISVTFMIYMINRQGRNEFKIAWFIPLMVVPLCVVVFYYLYHSDRGERMAKTALEKSKAETAEIMGMPELEASLKKQWPQVEDLQTYLIRQGFQPYDSCHLEYFSCGEDFLPDFLQSLRKAEEFIFIETFILKVEESWAEILSVLEQKAREGVEVRVMYDAFGSPMVSDRKYMKYLESKNIKACVFNPMIPFFTTKQNSRDHRKIYIVDGKTCYTGGINLANEYFNVGKNDFPYWKDNAVKVSGEAVKNFTVMFLQNWNMQQSAGEREDYARYMNLQYRKYDSSDIVIPYGDDAYNNEDVAENVYLYITNSAKKYLHITSPYILLDNTFLEALVFAAKKGIEVKLIVPSVGDHPVTFDIGTTYLKTLVDNGVRVYLYEKGFIHAKTFISDDVIATVGSVNLDYRSFYHHFECGAVMYGNPVIADIERDFQDTLLDCSEMKPGDYEKFPWMKRVVGRVFRVFAPLM